MRLVQVVVIFLLAFFLISCNPKPEEDKQPPVITLLGNNPITIKQGEAYIDAGATATDNIDGTVKVNKKGFVNYTEIGDYLITYKAEDKSGNTATKTRLVHVVDDGILKVSSLKNTSLNLDFICRETDNIEVIGSNLQQNPAVKPYFTGKDGLVKTVNNLFISEKTISFSCPKLSEGFYSFQIENNGKKRNFYKVQFISTESPIIKNLLINNNILAIEGENLNQNMDLYINDFSLKITNNQGDSNYINNVIIPKSILSGYVNLKTLTSQSNSKYLTIKKERNGSIELLNDSLTFNSITIWSQDNIVDIDSTGVFNIKSNQEKKYDFVFSKFSDTDQAYLSGVVLPDDGVISLDSLSTAISEVWHYLKVDYLSTKELLDLRTNLKKREDILDLALYINSSLKNDMLFLDSYTDSLKEKVKNIARKVYSDSISFNKQSRELKKFSGSSPAKISPEDYKGISLEELTDSSGNLLIKNDTTLPLSVKMTGTDGDVFLEHVQDIYAYGAISSQDYKYFSSETPLEQPKGRDVEVEVLTAGFFGQTAEANEDIVFNLRVKLFRDEIWNRLFFFLSDNTKLKKEILDIVLTPNVLLNLKNGDYAEVKTSINKSLNSFSFNKIKDALIDGLINPEEKFKRILKNFDLFYYFNLAFDLGNVNTTVVFDVIFPSNINAILPDKISFLDKNNSEFINFKIKGNGLKKYSEIKGGIVQISDTNDRFILNSGTVVSINDNGTEMEVKISLHDIKSLYINDSSIESINVKLNNIYDLSKKTNSILLEITNDIVLLSVEPKIVKYGNSVTIQGYGFYEYKDSLRIHVGTVSLSTSEFIIHKGDGNSPDAVTFKLVDGLQERMKPGSYKVVASGQRSEHYHESNSLNLMVVSNDAPIYIGRANPIIEMGIHKTRFLSNFGLDFSDKETKQENLSLSFKVLKGSDIISIDQNNDTLIGSKKGEAELLITATDEDELFVDQVYKIKVASYPPIYTSGLTSINILGADHLTPENVKTVSVIDYFSDNETKQEDLIFSFEILEGEGVISISQNGADVTILGKESGRASILITVTDEDELSTTKSFNVNVSCGEGSLVINGTLMWQDGGFDKNACGYNDWRQPTVEEVRQAILNADFKNLRDNTHYAGGDMSRTMFGDPVVTTVRYPDGKVVRLGLAYTKKAYGGYIGVRDQ